jgi:hypothetical protein
LCKVTIADASDVLSFACFGNAIGTNSTIDIRFFTKIMQDKLVLHAFYPKHNSKQIEVVPFFN